MTEAAETVAKCTEWVVPKGLSHYGGRPCGRDVKDEGRCGRHLAKLKRARAEMERAEVAREARRAQLDVVAAQVAALGVEGRPERDYRNTVTGNVVITMDELRRLVSEARGGEVE